MLRALDPDEPRPPSAYRVPWRVDRTSRTHPRATNASERPLDFVRVFIGRSAGGPETALWGRMLPGESAEVCLCDLDPDDTVVTLAWFRPENGLEYVWRFVV